MLFNKLSKSNTPHTFDEDMLADALEAASRHGHLNVARLLLDNNAKVDGVRRHDSPLQFASENGHEDVV
jgi:ankyrin repeat protein